VVVFVTPKGGGEKLPREGIYSSSGGRRVFLKKERKLYATIAGERKGEFLMIPQRKKKEGRVLLSYGNIM